MKLPIQFALTYPERLKTDFPRFNFANYPSLGFEKPDYETFKNLGLAFEAMNKGGNAPCILNAANEIAVKAFLEGRVSFTGMSEIIEACLGEIPFVQKPTLEDYINTDHTTRTFAESAIQINQIPG
jgi:1-deoxy-D-xylulose-5-phosphate reductoisomerase